VKIENLAKLSVTFYPPLQLMLYIFPGFLASIHDFPPLFGILLLSTLLDTFYLTLATSKTSVSLRAWNYPN
jgi:hypothetical protein